MSVADTKPLPAFIPWGKLEIEGSTLRSMHPLVDHCIDVACVMRELVGLRAIARALPLAAGRELSPVDIERLLCLTFLHDLGKASCVFQVKFWLRQGIQVQGWPSEGGHSYEAWALFDGHEARAQTILAGLPLEEMVTWGEEAVFSLLKASISHHGKPVSGSNGLDPAAWRPIVDSSCPYNPAETAALLGKTAKRLFPLAFDSEHPAASLPLPAGSAFAHLFAGLVQLADWLGSDTRFFPYTQPGEIREVTAAAAARRAMATLGLDPTDLLSSLEQSGPRDFSAIFQVPSPRPMQARMNGANMGRLVILESETGSGKTEAAIWRFYTLFSAGLVDGMYFATPTRVAATELCTRVERVINRIWPDGAPPVGPDALSVDAGRVPDAPRTRGWTAWLRCHQRGTLGCPAHAGMDPIFELLREGRTRMPRARGDGPCITTSKGFDREDAPRTRGWAAGCGLRACIDAGCPAHAGMDPRSLPGCRSSLGMPRARGDGPELEPMSTSNLKDAPRTRGSLMATQIPPSMATSNSPT